jgi:hypothetical protein
VTARVCVPHASLRRNPKELADCLKFVVISFHREGTQSEAIKVRDKDFERESADSVRSE